MSSHTLAALFVLAVWWLSTAAVLRLVWMGRSRVRFGAMSLIAVAGLVVTWKSAQLATVASAYAAFAAALVVWAWHELAFLLGMVTGSRKSACPPGATGWRRFVLATNVVLHHEVALAVTMLGMAALTWGQPNQVGTSAFLVLWIMRLSAKLNLFLGVRNFTETFVPQHLRYMLSYFRRARLNPLMPVSLVVGTAVAVRLGQDALAANITPFVVAGRSLVAALLGLAVVEHVFLALPLPDAILWSWAVRKATDDATDAANAAHARGSDADRGWGERARAPRNLRPDTETP